MHRCTDKGDKDFTIVQLTRTPQDFFFFLQSMKQGRQPEQRCSWCCKAHSSSIMNQRTGIDGCVVCPTEHANYYIYSTSQPHSDMGSTKKKKKLTLMFKTVCFALLTMKCFKKKKFDFRLFQNSLLVMR